ncbi:hypothetical protein FHW68_003839 [Pseudomonas sp. Tn43]|uniref:hypothetical protein n=1 Tax=Pseudomonas sp. Tn43 TaxID=701213 RepID=UPI00160CCBF1|nr:hypothetical protein [Pseudomonas sp. Tn43]MBB3242297.1 hypothetical protein [Pseudomonas sp. Tn43]
MSIGNPVMSVKGTIHPKGFCRKLGGQAVVWSICPISTVSVVEALNLRGTRQFFLVLMLDGCDEVARGRMPLVVVIQQVIMLAELAVNLALDNVDPA